MVWITRIIHERLFLEEHWLARPGEVDIHEIYEEANQMLIFTEEKDLEKVKALFKSGLLDVFLGLHDPEELHLILYENGLLTGEEYAMVNRLLYSGVDTEMFLRAIVQRCFVDYIYRQPPSSWNRSVLGLGADSIRDAIRDEGTNS